MDKQEKYDNWLKKYNKWEEDVGLTGKKGNIGWNHKDMDKILEWHRKNPPPEKPKPPPKPKFKDFMSVMSAMISGKYVSEERQLKRLEICHGCDNFVIDDGYPKCGVCGCKLDGDSKLIQLTAYEETEKYGCKHDAGSQWKKGGV